MTRRAESLRSRVLDRRSAGVRSQWQQRVDALEHRLRLVTIKARRCLIKDQNVSLFIETDRVAHSFSAINLPEGLSLDSSTGEITGSPQGPGNFDSILGATNQAGSLSKNITFEINDFSTNFSLFLTKKESFFVEN